MTRFGKLLSAALILVGTLFALQPAPARAAYSQAELEQLLAPIALYPDALLSQVLSAATRPLEIVEAARWSRANPGLQGDAAVRAAEDQPWDLSVQSLVAFPQLLARMDEDLEWTKTLGHAYFVQEPVVMETIQVLRRRARDAGQLPADDRLRIVDDGATIAIETPSPQILYLPYYDPWLVYGAWPWPAYPPVAWRPWPGYVVAARPGWPATAYWWGPGIGVSLHLFFGRIDWPRQRIYHPAPRPRAHPSAAHRAPPQFRPPPEHRAAPRRTEPHPRTAPRVERPRQSAPAPQATPVSPSPQRAAAPTHRPAQAHRPPPTRDTERAQVPRRESPRQAAPSPVPSSARADRPAPPPRARAIPREAREERESPPRRGVRP